MIDMPETIKIECQNCHNMIDAIKYPRMWVTKYGRAGGNKKAMNYVKDERIEYPKNCPICTKPMQQEKPMDKQRLLERIKASGLPERLTGFKVC